MYKSYMKASQIKATQTYLDTITTEELKEMLDDHNKYKDKKQKIKIPSKKAELIKLAQKYQLIPQYPILSEPEEKDTYVAKGNPNPKRLLMTPDYPKFVYEQPKKQTFTVDPIPMNEDIIEDVDLDATRNLSGRVVKSFMEGSGETPRIITISGDVKPARRMPMIQNATPIIPVATLKPSPVTSARLQAESKPAPKKRVAKAKVPKDEYTSLKVPELKDTLKQLGLKVSGTKSVLIQRLKDWQKS